MVQYSKDTCVKKKLWIFFLLLLLDVIRSDKKGQRRDGQKERGPGDRNHSLTDSPYCQTLAPLLDFPKTVLN
jgi:hypothetical protein